MCCYFILFLNKLKNCDMTWSDGQLDLPDVCPLPVFFICNQRALLCSKNCRKVVTSGCQPVYRTTANIITANQISNIPSATVPWAYDKQKGGGVEVLIFMELFSSEQGGGLGGWISKSNALQCCYSLQGETFYTEHPLSKLQCCHQGLVLEPTPFRRFTLCCAAPSDTAP